MAYIGQVDLIIFKLYKHSTFSYAKQQQQRQDHLREEVAVVDSTQSAPVGAIPTALYTTDELRSPEGHGSLLSQAGNSQ